MFLIQYSIVLADKIDTTILGFVLTDPGPANVVYDVVSKPFAHDLHFFAVAHCRDELRLTAYGLAVTCRRFAGMNRPQRGPGR